MKSNRKFSLKKGSLHKGADEHDLKKAGRLRKSTTTHEKLLWRHLRKGKLGVKFRRQHPLWHYVVDFYCYERNLVIELDGNIHDQKEQSAHDKNRDAELKKLGVKVLRFRNQEVEENINCNSEDKRSFVKGRMQLPILKYPIRPPSL